MARTIHLELVRSSRIATDLAAGGVFVQDKALAIQEVCELVVFNDGGELALAAKVVYVDGNGGVGLELVGFDADLRTKLADFVTAGEAASAAPEQVTERIELQELEDEAAADAAAAEDEPDDASEQTEAAVEDQGGTDEERQEFKGIHERLRGLPLIDQIKRAKAGDVTERTLLERMYGKNVWEALLRNPRVTPPEVARISRMGALPRPMLEIIFANGGWLQVPEVRRALLSNPRLGNDQIIKLLRMMPKPELKLATVQTAYSFAVRSAAKQLLKTEG